MNPNYHHPEHQAEHTLVGELLCHLPYAIFSVAFGLIVLSFVTYFSLGTETEMTCMRSDVLFHSFHFMHIVFAATGTVLTYFRFANDPIRGFLLGLISPAIFCTLSDSILPYLGGVMLGVPMQFHMCFLSELQNVLPFLLVGIFNGFVMSAHHKNKQSFYSVSSHAIHITISSLASIFYFVSNGCTNWHSMIGIIFVYLIGAVVVPCTLSDVVVPIMVARTKRS